MRCGAFGRRLAQHDPCFTNKILWNWSRTTASRHVKAVMASACVSGTPAVPKGLQRGFGVNAFQASVPPHLVQGWLGHALVVLRIEVHDLAGT